MPLYAEKMKLLVAQSCPALCDLTDCSPSTPDPGSSVHGILQARILCPFPEDLPNPGIKPRFPALQTDSFTSQQM